MDYKYFLKNSRNLKKCFDRSKKDTKEVFVKFATGLQPGPVKTQFGDLGLRGDDETAIKLWHGVNYCCIGIQINNLIIRIRTDKKFRLPTGLHWVLRELNPNAWWGIAKISTSDDLKLAVKAMKFGYNHFLPVRKNNKSHKTTLQSSSSTKPRISSLEKVVSQDIKAEEIEEKGPLGEGRIKQFYGKRYERNPINRTRAIETHGLSCNACGFNFKSAYGIRGAEFIEVHHKKPISSFEGRKIKINPKTDLITVCSNCHRMIHRKHNNILSIRDLKKILKK